jgi:uncharacterized membrane protein
MSFEEIKMNANPNSPIIFKDVKIDIKIKFSALWVALMFCYTYADILGFHAPGNLEEMISGEFAGIQMSQGMLFGSAILMAVPTMMVIISLVVKAKANRLVNIIAAIVYLVVLISTFFHREKSSILLVFCGLKSDTAWVNTLVHLEMAENRILKWQDASQSAN